MTLFKSPFSHLSRSAPVVVTNTALDYWCGQSNSQHSRLVQNIEMCTALCTGDDAWGLAISTNHPHTFIRVTLTPCSGPTGTTSEDTLLVERVLSTGGAFHSVSPITDSLSTGGTLFHPEVHDRISAIHGGPSSKVVRDCVVERTITFDDKPLSLGQLAQILEFVSRTTKVICDGGDCKFQSRSFAFTCLAAMTPTLPPRKAGAGLASNVSSGSELIDDSVFELTAEAFLAQVSCLVKEPTSMYTVGLIGALKAAPRGKARPRLYH